MFIKGQTRIRIALGDHKHVVYRTIGTGKRKRQARTEEQRDELIKHLEYRHQNKI